MWCHDVTGLHIFRVVLTERERENERASISLVTLCDCVVSRRPGNNKRWYFFSHTFAQSLNLGSHSKYSLVSDNRNIRLFRNGHQIGIKFIGNLRISEIFTRKSVYVGHRPRSGNYFRGQLCNVKIWNYPVNSGKV